MPEKASRMKWLFNEIGGIYLQFLIIVAIMIVFSFFLNSIFSIEDNETRIIFSSLFLVFFTGILVILRRI